jgi:hypothetical protein
MVLFLSNDDASSALLYIPKWCIRGAGRPVVQDACKVWTNWSSIHHSAPFIYHPSTQECLHKSSSMTHHSSMKDPVPAPTAHGVELVASSVHYHQLAMDISITTDDMADMTEVATQLCIAHPYDHKHQVSMFIMPQSLLASPPLINAFMRLTLCCSSLPLPPHHPCSSCKLDSKLLLAAVHQELLIDDMRSG